MLLFDAAAEPAWGPIWDPLTVSLMGLLGRGTEIRVDDWFWPGKGGPGAWGGRFAP